MPYLLLLDLYAFRVDQAANYVKTNLKKMTMVASAMLLTVPNCIVKVHTTIRLMVVRAIPSIPFHVNTHCLDCF